VLGRLQGVLGVLLDDGVQVLGDLHPQRRRRVTSGAARSGAPTTRQPQHPQPNRWRVTPRPAAGPVGGRWRRVAWPVAPGCVRRGRSRQAAAAGAGQCGGRGGRGAAVAPPPALSARQLPSHRRGPPPTAWCRCLCSVRYTSSSSRPLKISMSMTCGRGERTARRAGLHAAACARVGPRRAPQRPRCTHPGVGDVLVLLELLLDNGTHVSERDQLLQHEHFVNEGHAAAHLRQQRGRGQPGCALRPRSWALRARVGAPPCKTSCPCPRTALLARLLLQQPWLPPGTP